MIKVAIIGGNSQVAAEVALYFSLRDDIDFTGFTRSEYSAALFKLTGIKHDIIDFNNRQDICDKIKEFDVVIDFTYPAGQTREILKHIKKNILSVVSCMKSESVFIYMSSIMAYGMRDGDYVLKNYSFPRTTYSYIKRQTERYVVKMGKKFGVRAFNLRLGQVHGLLQAVRLNLLDSFVCNKIYVNGLKEEYTNTVFANSVAEAIIRCAKKLVPEGNHTLVSSPQWTLEELYEYYSKTSGLYPDIIYGVKDNPKHEQISGLVDYIWSKILKYRGVVESYVLFNMNFLTPYVKGYYRKKVVYNDLKSHQKNNNKKIHYHLLGAVNGNTIANIKSSLSEILEEERKIKDFLQNAVEENRK